MKLALFFLLSFIVHSTAFLVPISLNGWTTAPTIKVTILPLESLIEDNGGSGDRRAPVKQSATGKFAKSHFNGRRGDSTPPPNAAASEKVSLERPSGVADNGATAIAELSTVGIASGTGNGFASSSERGESNSASGINGAGSGSGNGNGAGAGQARATLTQARYRETPQPQYPSSARREGKEGRVLLRVLVDEEGRTKTIEVNTSSGHDLLDRAASEAIKKWRFVPAHAGGKPIETWIKVPIDFQLSNAKP
jgi:TonB family protein